jgi:hypothetical protein
MFPKLKTSKKYFKDLNMYKQVLEHIQDPRIKQRFSKLIIELEEQLRLIDSGHNSENNGYINPAGVRENVTNAVQLRQQLDKFVKDLNRT